MKYLWSRAFIIFRIFVSAWQIMLRVIFRFFNIIPINFCFRRCQSAFCCVIVTCLRQPKLKTVDASLFFGHLSALIPIDLCHVPITISTQNNENREIKYAKENLPFFINKKSNTYIYAVDGYKEKKQ